MKPLPLNIISSLLVLSMSLLVTDVHAQAPVGPAAAPEASQTVTLDFKDADINTVLRVMSLKSGMNIVAGPEVQGTVSIRLEDVPWQKALDVVLRTYGYVYERDGNIIRVTTRENLAQEAVITKTFILNYSKAPEIQTAVQDMLTERGRVKVAERMNMLVITDIPTNLYRIEEVVYKLDQVTSQAFVDSKVVRTDVGVSENLGIQWTPTAGLSGSSRPTTFPFGTDTSSGGENMGHFVRQFFPILGGDPATSETLPDTRFFPTPEASATATYAFGTLDFSAFAATLNFLKSRSNTKVVSNPRVVVLNNQTAKVQVGSDIPLPTFERNETTGSVEISGFSFREIGVVLNVTPHINSAQEILVDLQPEVSSTGANVDFGDFSIPSFNVTKAITQVLIRSGETIAIGGLLTDNSATTEAKVPVLGDIPVVGKLFRSKRQEANANSKIETLFFVTVTMVDTEGQPVRANRDDDDARGARDESTASTSEDAGTQSTTKESAADSAQDTSPEIESQVQPEPVLAG